MKIFISLRKNPTAGFYYDILNYLLKKGSRDEIESYLNILEKRNKGE